jgi:hypothetical protein
MSAVETTRTEHDLGQILRRWGPDYSRTHPVPAGQRRVMEQLAACRTAALGGHVERCEVCGHERPVYNSCGNRHCPTCQGKLARKWLAERLQDVLATAYFHCVFTIPDAFNVLVPRNERTVYNLLFRAVSQTLKYFARKQLGGEPGVVAVLHTWGQTLWPHPHLHCIVTGGALSFDRRRWVSTGPDFLFDVHELSAEFRKRLCRMLRRAPLTLADDAAHLAAGGALDRLIAEQEQRDWVVYSKKPETGPSQILHYISRYTHRVAISNRRILDISEAGTVTVEYKDYRDCDSGGRPTRKLMHLRATEFIGRFLRHVLPSGFRKIRCYGLLAGKDKAAKLAAARSLLGPVPEPAAPDRPDEAAASAQQQHLCPRCGTGTMQKAGVLKPQRAPPVVLACEATPKAPKAA